MKKRVGSQRVSHSVRERAKLVSEILDREIPSLEIPLHHADPFTLLCAVLLSAQCTDARVNEVTPGLFALANHPQAMADLPIEVIEAAIQRCGLYRTKARALKELSRCLIEKHDGLVPIDFDALEALPGVGHKTASVVMVQAFGVPAFPVDTHIARCAKRWGLSSSDDVVEVEERLKRLFPVEQWGDRHLQIILFARRFCPARGHQVASCPICSRLDVQRS
jgi:endonuclease III